MKKRNLFLKIGSFVLAALVIAVAAPILKSSAETAGITTDARAAMLMDFDTGTVIYENNATKRQPIASMVKIMTLLLSFEEADSGRLDYDADIVVSQNAASMGGSQAFLDANSSYKVNDLLQSIVVASANDSCVAMAEHISGSVEAFVEKMNEKAKSLGMENTHFVNCTGLPAEGQYCCAKDVAAMSRELFGHKKFFEYSGVWMYDFQHPGGRTTRLTNTNKLIRAYEGCDGGKTGFTNEAMSCLSATAKRGDTRLMSIVIGAADSKKRNAEVCKLLNYGFANYETKEIVKGGEKLPEVLQVRNGKTAEVEARFKNSYYCFDKKTNKSDYAVTYEMGEIAAPVRDGDTVGKVIVSKDGEAVGEVEIVACGDVEKMGYIDIVDDFIAKW